MFTCTLLVMHGGHVKGSRLWVVLDPFSMFMSD